MGIINRRSGPISKMKKCVLTVSKKDTKEVVTTSETLFNKWPNLAGPYLNNHVIYELRKAGWAQIITDHLVFEYRVHDDN